MKNSKRRAPACLPTLPITCQVPYHIGLELQAKAQKLGITRHRLFLVAFETGFPIVLEQDSVHKASNPAALQQQG